MKEEEKLLELGRRMEKNLQTGILPFWREFMADPVHGGFYGRVDGERKPDLQSPKSVVLNCRMLWTFSRAYEFFGNEQDRELAKRAYDYICRCFWDECYQGVYWMVTARGEPSEPEKRTYGQAFFIFSMAEYYRVFGDSRALKLAMRVFSLVEENLRLPEGGYADSASRDWLQDDWLNFWVKNRMGARKLLNSNMHLFEAFLALAEVSREEKVLQSLKEELCFLLEVAVDRENGHMKAAMAEDGSRLDGEINFGHDCECSYLMLQAAELLQEEVLCEKTESIVGRMMERVYEESLDPACGGMYYLAELETGRVNRSKIWWVQAEGITAFTDRYQRTGEQKYLDVAVSIWDYVEEYMVNKNLGEWFCVGQEPLGKADEKEISAIFSNKEMAGKGKCPYHNSRACFEMIRRTKIKK